MLKTRSPWLSWGLALWTCCLSQSLGAQDSALPPGAEMLLPPATPEDNSPNGLYLAGMNLLHSDPPDYFGAIAKLEEARRQRPDHVPTLSNLAAAYLKTGRNEEAMETALAAVRLGPESPDAHRNLGDAYLAHRRATEALAEYDLAIGKGDKDAVTYFNRGIALLVMDQKDRAIVDFKRATESDPQLGPAQLKLGELLALDGLHEAAVGHLQAARKLMGNDPEVLYNLAHSLQKTGDNEAMAEAACALMERAVEPSHPVPVEMMMATQKLLGDRPCVVKMSAPPEKP